MKTLRRYNCRAADEKQVQEEGKRLMDDPNTTLAQYVGFLKTEYKAIKYMEADLMKIEKKVRELNIEKEKKITEEPVDMGKIMGRVKYFLENLDKLLLQQIDPIKKARFFGVFFDKAPSYAELKTGTENMAKITEISKLFELTDPDIPGLVAPPRACPNGHNICSHARYKHLCVALICELASSSPL